MATIASPSAVMRPAPSRAPIASRPAFAAAIDAAGGGEGLGRMDDLLASFNRLDVPTADQIEILRALHRAGKLHAKLIIDGIEQ